MKKFISGVVVGVLLFAGASAFADGVSIFGKKVSGVYTIEKDGKKIADAGIIDGSAYVPVRAISEAAGVTLKVDSERKKITMNTDKSKSTVVIDGVEYDPGIKLAGEISTLEERITGYQSNIDRTNKYEVVPAEENLSKAKVSDNGTPESALVISSLEQRIKESKQYIAEQQLLIDKAKAEIETLQTQKTSK